MRSNRSKIGHPRSRQSNARRWDARLMSAIACILAAILSAPASQAAVQLPANAAACVRWAAGDLDAALRSAGLNPENAEVMVTLPPSSISSLPPTISVEEQSFSLAVNHGAVTIQAGGAVGAMYGLEELTEQVRNEPNLHRGSLPPTWNRMAGSLRATTQKPFLTIRADNMFIHTSGTSEPMPPNGYPLSLNNLPMWRAYIDMLARDRYNLLDLHGAYDLESTYFPNLYPMLVHVPEYPDAGNEAAQKRNLASLRAIITYAQSRGVRVALMNYSAANGFGGQYRHQASVTGVPADHLADYTAKAVTSLINSLPDLYMLGFRVGETAQPASFFQDAYLKGIAESNRPGIHLYTRSWLTTKSQLVPIARAAKDGFDIEIKFNGEQLGLPYQALQGPGYGSYSYQGYLDVPADYRILWQVRANGTHRFWSWENTDFIRRTVRSCRLGNALGYTLEPESAYFPSAPDQYYRSAADQHTYSYIWQKNWMWYYAWGRLGYNPNLSENEFLHAFKRHYGAVGAAAYRAMQQSGTILPLAFAYRFQGPDQRDFSPETETGNLYTTGVKKQTHPGLLQFAWNTPEDDRTFAGIHEYVEDRVAGKPDGRVTPFTVARQLAAAARATRQTLASASKAPAADTGAWRLLQVDLLAAADLGDYYAARIRGMTYLDYALHTGDAQDYHTAVSDLVASRQAWSRLSQAADAVYRPLANPLRHQLNFQWSSQLAPLKQVDATAAALWQKHESIQPRLPLLPDTSSPDFGRVTLTARKTGSQVQILSTPGRKGSVASAVLWFKPLPSELPWSSVAMKPAEGSSGWTATVPLDSQGLMYTVELIDRHGAARNFPDSPPETPWEILPAYPAAAK